MTKIHIDPKPPAPALTPEQVEAVLRSPECAELIAVLAATVREVVQSSSTKAN